MDKNTFGRPARSGPSANRRDGAGGLIGPGLPPFGGEFMAEPHHDLVGGRKPALRSYSCSLWLGLWLAFSLVCSAEENNSSRPTPEPQRDRQWTVYLAQDKHLDYNWCGSTTEIELRMAAVLDYFVDAAQRDEACWNLDGTLWDEVYRRHRGDAGCVRLHDAIRKGRIGYAGNYAVLLWGILDTETAIRACYGAVPIEHSTGVPARTALIMENPGLTWGIANVLTECGFDFVGRGIYRLRAESYNPNRDAYPLFWWKAPNGKRILIRWDLYDDTKSWGGYAEAFRLAELAGVRPDAGRLQEMDVCNDQDVFEKRKAYIHQTVARYETYGNAYPISSILLLGTGHDGWIRTTDISHFIRRYNADSDGRVRLIDATYQDFFAAAERQIHDKNLDIPTLTGSFGICWEEWAAHLAGLTSQFREAERLLRLAEAANAFEKLARHADSGLAGREDANKSRLIRHGMVQLLKFAEHDFGGTDRQRAALSAGARASAVTQAMDIARALAPKSLTTAAVPAGRQAPQAGAFKPEAMTFEWRGGRVVFDPQRCAVISLTDAAGRSWVPGGQAVALGEFKHTRYRSRARPDSVFPQPLPDPAEPVLQNLVSRRADHGVEIMADFDRSGFRVESTWLFHAANPWIDVTYRLKNGWSDDPQTVEFCFPFVIDNPTYRYDAPAVILAAGPKQAGGDDLPGANPELYAGLTFAAASGDARTALVLAPDTLLLRFGPNAVRAADGSTSDVPSLITSMPMMNLTGNDWQFGQGGWHEWSFSYRIVLLDGEFDPVRAIQEAQEFGTPPFLHVPGQSPALSGLEALDIDFDSGPLTAFKIAEDNRRLILRFWNVVNRTAYGSLKLPPGWAQAEICDALERPRKKLDAVDGRVRFSAGPLGILTVALTQQE